LLRIHKLVEEHQPDVVVIDPVTNLTVGTMNELHSTLMRLIDFLKSRGTTALLTSLTSGKSRELEQTEVGISSLIDTWIFLRDVELNGERNRCLYVLKSRGMAHSNQVREFVMTNEGVHLLPVYVGAGKVLTGSARLSQEARERWEEQSRQLETEQKRKELERRRAAVETQIEGLRAQLAEDEDRLRQVIQEEEGRKQQVEEEAAAMSKIRRVESAGNGRKTMAEGA
jgi:circadian clock protein KaiC